MRGGIQFGFLLVYAALAACTFAASPPGKAPPPNSVELDAGPCVTVYRTFEGEVCQGTVNGIIERSCLLRELFDVSDAEPFEVYLASGTAAVTQWCGAEAGGCVVGNTAVSTWGSMNHELVHLAIHASVGHGVHRHMDEGIPVILDGKSDWEFPSAPLPIEPLFQEESLSRDAAADLSSWLLESYDFQTLMAVVSQTSKGGELEELSDSLEDVLGLPLVEIVADYEASASVARPERPITAVDVDFDALAGGVELSLSCEDPETEGFSGEPRRYRVRMENSREESVDFSLQFIWDGES